MKSNHIPVEDRLRPHINKLYDKINFGDYWTRKKYYPKCRYCGITIISCNMNDGQHHSGCKVTGIEKEILFYKKLMKGEAS